MAVPCGMSFMTFDGNDHAAEKDACNWEKEAAMEYFGEILSLKVLYNEESLQLESFSQGERLVKTSRLATIYSNSRQATFIDTHINLHEVYDEIDYIQIGQQDII